MCTKVNQTQKLFFNTGASKNTIQNPHIRHFPMARPVSGTHHIVKYVGKISKTHPPSQAYKFYGK